MSDTSRKKIVIKRETGGDSVAIVYNLPSFPTSTPPSPTFTPSLISLMVSVDIKHHVYQLKNKANGVTSDLGTKFRPYIPLSPLPLALNVKRQSINYVTHPRHPPLPLAFSIKQQRVDDVTNPRHLPLPLALNIKEQGLEDDTHPRLLNLPLIFSIKRQGLDHITAKP